MHSTRVRVWDKNAGCFVYGNLSVESLVDLFPEGEMDPELVNNYIFTVGTEDVYEKDILKSVHFKDGDETYYLYHVVLWSTHEHQFIAINKPHYDEGHYSTCEHGNISLSLYLKNVRNFEVEGHVNEPNKTKSDGVQSEICGDDTAGDSV